MRQQEAEPGSLVADRRLFLTADGKVVEDGDPGRVSLITAPGATVTAADAERYGLSLEGEKLVVGTPKPPAQPPLPETEPVTVPVTEAEEKPAKSMKPPKNNSGA